MDGKRSILPKGVRRTVFFGSLLLLLVHTFNTELTSTLHLTLTVDALTVALVVLACLPWLLDRITGIKAGDVEITLSEIQEPVKELEAAAKSEAGKTVQMTAEATGSAAVSAQMTADTSGAAAIAGSLPDTSDPVVLFAVVRLEIERRLKTLAEISGIASSANAASIGRMMVKLVNYGVIPPDVADPLGNYVSVANAAIHGAEMSPEAVDEARSSAPSVLAVLDSLIAEASAAKGGG